MVTLRSALRAGHVALAPPPPPHREAGMDSASQGPGASLGVPLGTCPRVSGARRSLPPPPAKTPGLWLPEWSLEMICGFSSSERFPLSSPTWMCTGLWPRDQGGHIGAFGTLGSFLGVTLHTGPRPPEIRSSCPFGVGRAVRFVHTHSACWGLVHCSLSGPTGLVASAAGQHREEGRGLARALQAAGARDRDGGSAHLLSCGPGRAGRLERAGGGAERCPPPGPRRGEECMAWGERVQASLGWAVGVAQSQPLCLLNGQLHPRP